MTPKFEVKKAEEPKEDKEAKLVEDLIKAGSSCSLCGVGFTPNIRPKVEKLEKKVYVATCGQPKKAGQTEQVYVEVDDSPSGFKEIPARIYNK